MDTGTHGHTRRLFFLDVSIRNSLRSNYCRWSPAAVENNPCRREDCRNRTCLQRRRQGSRQSSSRIPRAHIRTLPPVVVTSASLLLPPTPSIPCFRCRRDSSPKNRAAVRWEIVHAANQAGNQAENYPAATPRSPRLGPGRARTKDEAGCSCGHVLRVQLRIARMARVPGSAGTRG